MNRIGVCVVFGLLGAVLTGPISFAQTTAQISGAVKDQTGAVLPGVEISVTQTATGAKRTVVTNETGSYVVASLPIGPYMVEAGLPGFKTYVQTGIVLQVNASPTINIVLEVGQVSDQVEVQADAALVETRSVGVGTVIDNTRVLEMPLNGRNVTELIFLAGMATTGNSGFLNSVRNYPTVNISVTGGVANWTQYNFDGTAHNDAYNSLNLPLPFPDALQEFKVESSALQAQYGVHASANVNVITKSGTNQIHGDAFEFVRNGIFNARNFFAPKRDTLKRNQFGGVLGGPIVKNKLFFFGGYQGTIQRSEPTQNIAWIPTTEMLSGDFTTITSPACNGGKSIPLSAAQGFVNNKISTSSFNPAALRVTALLPVSEADSCGKVNFGLKSNQVEHMEVLKLDYTKSQRNSWFGRFFVTDLEIPSTYDGKNALTMNANAQDDRVYALSIGNTFLISQNVVSAFRIGANRSKILKVTDKMATWPELGVNAPYTPDTEPRVTVTGGNGFSIGSGSSIINWDIGGPNPSTSEDLSWARGAHQIGFGASWFKTFLNYGSGVNASGSMSFDGSATGLGLADFLLGRVRQWNQGNVQSFLVNRQSYFGSYIQDSWKATSRLTVNYGVRYEPYFAFTNKRGWFSHFDEALFDQGVRSTVYVNAPPGFIYPGDPQWSPGGNRVAHNRYGIFLPRLGFAWDPKGDGSMSVRASVGVFTDRGALYSMSAMAQDAPYGSNIAIPNVNMSDPWATYPGGNPLPFVLNKNYQFPAFGAFVTANLHWHPTWVNQFNLSVQKSFGKDWLIAANYVGNTTSHLINAGQINPAIFLGLGPCTINTVTGPVSPAVCSTTGNTNQRRRLSLKDPVKGQYFGILSTQDDGGTGSYNAMYLQLQKRLSGGVSVLSNYTWSHCIADLWNGNPGNTGGSAVVPGNRKADRSNCDANQGNDQRHIFNLSAVLQTPRFANHTLALLASDWQLSPILKMKSGTFFTVNLGVDTALNGEGGANQRPNLKPGVDVYASNKGVDGWLNRDAFETPALGTLGNLGRNNVVGPGSVQLDLALSRTFPIREGQTVQLRAEAFNVPNHLNPSNPVSALNSASFGKIQSDISGTSGLSPGNQRIMQFALKYVF